MWKSLHTFYSSLNDFWKGVLRFAKWVLIFGLLWKVCWWGYWMFFSPTVITDWNETDVTITSPSNARVTLHKLRPWTIYGVVIYSVRIIDPILPTIGKFPESFIAPVDVLLGCGRLLRAEDFAKVRANHEFRTAEVYGMEGPEEVAHEHIIPANYLILLDAINLKNGDLVNMTGDIVDIHIDDRKYLTSDSRSDTNSTARGGGACEIFFLKKIEKVGRIH